MASGQLRLEPVVAILKLPEALGGFLEQEIDLFSKDALVD